jgi:hypothetical protein
MLKYPASRVGTEHPMVVDVDEAKHWFREIIQHVHRHIVISIQYSSGARSPFVIAGDSAGTDARNKISGGNAQFTIQGLTDPNKLLGFGFDTTNNFAWMQAVRYSTANVPLKLQPNGGDLVLGGANSVVTLSPTGTGNVVISPASAGSIDNMAIGGTTARAGFFTTVTAGGQIQSLVATGTAPLVIASTTLVPNLDVALADAAPVSGITGLGTGVATALAINVGSAGAPVVNGGALGTPSSGVGTNLTGTAAGLTAGTATNATNVATTSTSTNATFYPLFVASSSNSNQAASLSTKITVNPAGGIGVLGIADASTDTGIIVNNTNSGGRSWGITSSATSSGLGAGTSCWYDATTGGITGGRLCINSSGIVTASVALVTTAVAVASLPS